MITQVSYARLYNTGNYENLRLEAVATVENDDVQAAFAEARAAVHEQYAAITAEREEAERRRREEYEARMAQERAEREARRPARTTVDDGDPSF